MIKLLTMLIVWSF